MAVADFIMLGIGGDGIGIPVSVTTAADPQLQFFENFPGKDGAEFFNLSQRTMSVHAVNIPLSLSFGVPVMLLTVGATDATRSATITINLGLYSLNGSTLSLANSASGSWTNAGSNTSTVWVSMVTSATQNITPGAWYWGVAGFMNANAGADYQAFWGNSSINPGNASPVFIRGRRTVSNATGVMPASIATSELDITGSDATRQPYVIITA